MACQSEPIPGHTLRPLPTLSGFWPGLPGLPSLNAHGIRTTDHEEETGILAVHRGAQEVRTTHKEGEVWGSSIPGETYYAEEEIPKARSPQNWAAKALGFQGFLVGTPPSSQLIPVLRQRSQKQRKTGGGDGRTQTRSSGLSQPLLPWQRCYFYLVVGDAQSSHFLCSREARLASALVLQRGTFSQRPEEEEE